MSAIPFPAQAGSVPAWDQTATPLRSQLRPDIQLLPGQRQPNGQPTWLLYDPARDRYITIGWLERELLRYWHVADDELIIDSVLASTTLDVDQQEINDFQEFLVQQELVVKSTQEDLGLFKRMQKQRAQALRQSLFQRQLFRRFTLLHPDRFLTATLPLVKPLFSAWWRCLVVVSLVVCLLLIGRQWSLFMQSIAALFVWQAVPMLFVALFVIKAIHELGHAYTCKYYGLSVPSMGVALFLFWPFLFTNTNSAWRLTDRRQRMAVGLAGVLAEFYVAVLCINLWLILPDGPGRSAALFLGTVSLLTTVVINANPFMRWDGYYVLADWLAVDNMQPRAFGLGKWWMRRRLFGFEDPSPENFSQRITRVLLVYAYMTWVYRFVLFSGLALLVYSGLYKALGLAIGALFLYWFIAKPVILEIQFLMSKRQDIVLNKHTAISLSIVAGLVAGILLPLDTTVSSKAQVMAIRQQAVYPPASGRIKQLDLLPSQYVTQGQSLFEVESVDNSYQLAHVVSRERQYGVMLDRLADQKVLQQRAVLKTQLAYLNEQKRGLINQHKQLHVSAPFAGQITQVSDQLREQGWVSEKKPVLTLVDRSRYKLVAYVDQSDLQRLQIGASARFISENTAVPRMVLTLSAIDKSPALTLESPSLAQHHGGDVPTTQSSTEKLTNEVVGRDAAWSTPHGSYFRLTFTPDDHSRFLSFTPSRGTVHVDSASRSLGRQIWDGLAGLVIRESGF